MEALKIGKWGEKYEGTILASLALAALHYADPSMIYSAVAERYPDKDFAEWRASVEVTRANMRHAQDGPLDRR